MICLWGRCQSWILWCVEGSCGANEPQPPSPQMVIVICLSMFGACIYVQMDKRRSLDDIESASAAF